MSDLTILYYTANLIEEPFANAVRERLWSVVGGLPIISVSHRPVAFGQNICIGVHPPSEYGIFRAIFIGALVAQTPYVATAEDDVAYTAEHFAHRPPDLSTFSYNLTRWQANPTEFFLRECVSMGMCIAPTGALISNLAHRFAIDPLRPEKLTFWSEPGRKGEVINKLPQVPVETFRTVSPQVMVNRRGSVGGKRKVLPTDTIATELPGIGTAPDFWKVIHGIS